MENLNLYFIAERKIWHNGETVKNVNFGPAEIDKPLKIQTINVSKLILYNKYDGMNIKYLLNFFLSCVMDTHVLPFYHQSNILREYYKIVIPTQRDMEKWSDSGNELSNIFDYIKVCVNCVHYYMQIGPAVWKLITLLSVVYRISTLFCLVLIPQPIN